MLHNCQSMEYIKIAFKSLPPKIGWSIHLIPLIGLYIVKLIGGIIVVVGILFEHGCLVT